MPSARIVVVEDEADIRTCIEYALDSRGYKVTTAADAAEGLAVIHSEAPDLVLLDRMLPDMDGLELCRKLRRDPATRTLRVVIVSARDAEADVVGGLGEGADDYVPKPFRPAELVARIAAVLRRSAPHAEPIPPGRIRIGPLLVDGDARRVTFEQRELNLHPAEIRLLHLLGSEPGRVFTRSQILDRILVGSPDLVYRNVDLLVASLRRKLGEAASLIEPVRDLGYRMRDVAA